MENCFWLAINLSFVGVGIFLFWKGDPATGSIAILFGGSCAVIAAWEVLQPRIKYLQGDSVTLNALKKTLIVKSSIAHFAVYTIACAGFFLEGVLMIATGKGLSIGWMTAGLCGPGTFVLLWQVIDRRPRLIIDSDGVIDRTLGVGRIVWEDIESAHLQSMNGNDFICLTLRDPSIYINQMSWMQRKLSNANTALGFGVLNLNLAGITVPSEEVFQLVMWHVLDHQ